MVKPMLGAVIAMILISDSRACANDAEDRVLALVRKLGGKIVRDEMRSDRPIVKVDLSGCKITDADLCALAPLQSLTTLRLSRTSVTDAELKELAPLQMLMALDLSYTKVTNTGLSELSGLRNIKTLELQSAHVTDRGLKHLALFKQLTTQSLKHCGVRCWLARPESNSNAICALLE